MNKTTSRVIQISDLVQWSKKGELELSPKYQRGSVWNDNAKAYLIDTIVRGLPIPPIFMRQRVDINTKSTSREIIDGQQRIRAILEYVVDEEFGIKKSHNKEFGGLKYSQLDPEVQEAILEYDIVAEVVTEKDESIIYDMFARLNSNNVVLNKQELRNSRYWGEFKVLVYNLASKHRDFFLDYGILSDKDCTRMKDAELITSMLVILLEGIVQETPTYVDKLYEKYDGSFEKATEIEYELNSVMDIAELIYEYFNGNLVCLTNKNYFFTLYSVLVNQMYGIANQQLKRNDRFTCENITNHINELKDCCGMFLRIYDEKLSDTENSKTIDSEWIEFRKNHNSRTTSKIERARRIEFLNNYFTGE